MKTESRCKDQMAIHRLTTPISEEIIRKISANDTLFLSGTMVTARDRAHVRALEFAKAGKSLPVNLDGLAVFHCGPVAQKRDSNWIVVAAGPTTSTRMEKYESEFIKAFKPRVIVGKGGMGEKTARALAEYGAVYCAFTGGAAVVAAKAIKKVPAVHWLDLGMPEAMWVLEVLDFGPMVVAIDSHGKNVFSDVAGRVAKNRVNIQRVFEL